MKTINNFNIKKKNILLRVDLNVPVVDGEITDRSRISSVKKTILKLIESESKIFLLSHYGRPKGKYNKKLSLEFLSSVLCEELNINKIDFVKSIVPKILENQIKKMKPGEICLIENIRFFQEEENNDLEFSKQLSINFDLYINDAFSASHRKHASIVGITRFLPSIAGYSFIQEMKNLNNFLNNPKKPNTAIIGGSKISTKIEIINNLVEHFDNIIIGGAMANTFLLSKGYSLGKSLVEDSLTDIAISIINKAKDYKCNIILPVDVMCSKNLNDPKNILQLEVENILPDQMVLDLGEKSIQKIIKIILNSNMVLWNGPLGAFEYKPFNHATLEIANAIKKNANLSNITTLAGGGDTLAALKMADAQDSFSYISNSGGAFLEWLEGKESPGVKALRDNNIF